MNVSNLKGFVKATITKGTYVLEIVSVKESEGKNADANGQFTPILNFDYKIVGPDSATKTNNESAINEHIFEMVCLPRESTSAAGKDMMMANMKMHLVAAFGEDFPDEITTEDWVGKLVQANVEVDFDDYSKEDKPVVKKLQAYVASN